MSTTVRAIILYEMTWAVVNFLSKLQGGYMHYVTSSNPVTNVALVKMCEGKVAKSLGPTYHIYL